MKIRTDFVSNSSSSSFIVSTKESVDALINHIVNYAHPDYDNDESFCWSKSYNINNRNFLEGNIGRFTALTIGDFDFIGGTDCDEDEEFYAVKNLSNKVVKTSDIHKFIENGEVKIKDIPTIMKSGIMNRGYKVYEITQDTIDFTRWLYSQVRPNINRPELQALYKFGGIAIDGKTIDSGNVCKNWYDWYENLTDQQRSEYTRLSDACKGIMLVDGISTYNSSDNTFKFKPLPTVLDNIETKLKSGYRIFRICFGHSGEGTDWSAYVWTSGYHFLEHDKDKFEFEYDTDY